ncbi:C-C motif chemokine 4 [Nothobranchius furzeri]|uniref:C-C motif chemokine 4-like n=2 Tax=Nothobranchius TaxID=28779 RepID=A0A9D2YM70_NOTFU|nr:C-C motif chemokine 4 [Nothobranchius furzeri]KAF7222688.1 C-C motif chemokine 4-like [Nothobranchius furzeri]
MMTKLAVCVSVTLLLIALSQATPRTPCCTNYQIKRIPLRFLTNYTIQEDTGGCRLKAIIFTVLPNNIACGNPYEPWVITAMKAIVSRNNRRPSKTSDAIK